MADWARDSPRWCLPHGTGSCRARLTGSGRTLQACHRSTDSAGRPPSPRVREPFIRGAVGPLVAKAARVLLGQLTAERIQQCLVERAQLAVHGRVPASHAQRLLSTSPVAVRRPIAVDGATPSVPVASRPTPAETVPAPATAPRPARPPVAPVRLITHVVRCWLSALRSRRAARHPQAYSAPADEVTGCCVS